jgi:hypothetical protein
MSKIEDVNNLTVKNLRQEFEKVFSHIGLKEIGFLFDYKRPEIEFFKAQILVKGLKQFHITVLPNLRDEEKRECVREIIRVWNIKKTEIRNL